MDRLELVREQISAVMDRMADPYERQCARAHTYGVSELCVLLAVKRGEERELAAAAGLLHDVYAFSTGIRINHAAEGAVMAQEILERTEAFSSQEVEQICQAIARHSMKRMRHTAFDEILKDADVWQHCLYDAAFQMEKWQRIRYEGLKREFGF